MNGLIMLVIVNIDESKKTKLKIDEHTHSSLFDFIDHLFFYSNERIEEL